MIASGSKTIGSAKPFLQRRLSQQPDEDERHRIFQRRCVSAYRLLSIDLYDTDQKKGGGDGYSLYERDQLVLLARKFAAGCSDDEDRDGMSDGGQDLDLGKSTDLRGAGSGWLARSQSMMRPQLRSRQSSSTLLIHPRSAAAASTAGSMSEADSLNRARYLTACSQLGAKPSQKFVDCLTKQSAVFELRGLHLGLSGAAACAAGLRNNAHLRSLILEDNELRCLGCQQVVPIVVDNPFLTELRLIDNAINVRGLTQLTDALIRTTSLKILDLSGNRFEEKCGLQLRKLLEENRSIEELYVAHNNFREKGTIAIAYGLAANESVKLLDVSWNHIRLSGAVCLCDSLRVNRTLETALLAWNGLYIEGCKSLAKSLQANETLQRLDISCNRIDIKCLEFLFKGLKANKSLKRLRVSQNPLTAQNIKVFLGKVEEQRFNIEELDLTGLTVDPQSVAIADRISQSRKFAIIYGVLLKQESKSEEDDQFLDDDPMMVLMEFMKLKNMRLVDLFLSLDADGSKSLSHKEFKEGLATVGVPMSPMCVQRLVRVLDRDGDGEIDYSELIAGQREHRRRLMKIQAMERNVPYEETELGSINLKLRRLLAKRERDKREARATEIGAAAASGATGSAPPPGSFNRKQAPLSSGPRILDVALKVFNSAVSTELATLEK